ncbi:MAG: ribosomal protein S18-alanine N-acetyltransferase [Gallionella sp.]|nr:ribosomal protein S18-alanine N-acetyltransferase [Gallionella sp.]
MRDMTLADIDAVCAIEQLVQPYPWSRGNFTDALGSGYRCVVDEVVGQIVSYAVLMPVLDEAELLNIGVAAAQQRKGLGKAMLDAQMQWARTQNMQRIFLEVRVSNLPAIALYRAVGFIEIGMRRGYYQNAAGREDAMAMACELNKEAQVKLHG